MKKTVKSGTDEKYASQIEKVKKNYKGYMKKGMQLLKEADTYLEKNREPIFIHNRRY